MSDSGQHVEHLPRLILVGDGFTEDAQARRIVAAVEGGVRWVQLRDHEARLAVIEQAAQRLVSRLRTVAPPVFISINTAVGLAAALDAGLHLGRRGPSVEAARQQVGGKSIIGFSAHSLEEALRAVEADVDYLCYSPVFPTKSKPGHSGHGLDGLRVVSETVAPVPVYALGGITPVRVADCREAGAHGVAVLSGILYALDPGAAAQDYLEALK